MLVDEKEDIIATVTAPTGRPAAASGNHQALSTQRSALTRRHVAQLGGTTSLGDCLIALRYLLDPWHLVRGPMLARYEKAFARQVGVRYAYSFSSGRVGLYGLLRVLGIGAGDDVLLQVPTHIVVPNAVRFAGARPVYVDCRLDTYNMDMEQAERHITPRTKAIVLQHTFGIPADIDAALDLAQRHGLVVIEDCVHALGATYKGRQVGSFGRAGFFSTEETKTISTTMGGMVVTDDPELAAKVAAFQESCPWPSASLTARYVLKLIAYHVLTEPHVHRYVRALYERFGRRQPLPRATSAKEMLGVRPANYEQRLGNAQAALGLRQLKRLRHNLARRRARGEEYKTLLSKYGVKPLCPPPGAEPAYVRYPLWVEDRDEAMKRASAHALLGTWFTSVLEEAATPAHGGYEMGSCPRAEAAAVHLVNLPTHPRVKSGDVKAIVREIMN